jgi:hypothetical protein
MSTGTQGGTARWWAAVVIGTGGALLVAWLARLAGVPAATLAAIVGGAAALAWMIVLVTGPWNLYFGALGIVADLAESRRRGLPVRAEQQDEARQIAARMLGFALGGHLITAVAAAVISYVVGQRAGYYLAGFYLLSAALRPAAAYFGHLRRRLTALGREARYPREDVVTLREQVAATDESVRALHAEVARLGTDQHELSRLVGGLGRRVESALDGVADYGELAAGLRALVRMIRSDLA